MAARKEEEEREAKKLEETKLQFQAEIEEMKLKMDIEMRRGTRIEIIQKDIIKEDISHTLTEKENVLCLLIRIALEMTTFLEIGMNLIENC